MKTDNIAKLKANLSRYLKLVQRGERVVVLDRRTPVAELVPYQPAPEEVFERLAREGKCRLGRQNFKDLKFTPLGLSSRQLDKFVADAKADR